MACGGNLPKLSINFLTNAQKLKRGFWPWTKGLKSRLPMHYMVRYTETWMKEPEPVHYVKENRKYVPDENGLPTKVYNKPLELIQPQEADLGLWGGEAIVAGIRESISRFKTARSPKYWRPFLTRRVFYSEILDKYLDITVTLRTLDLIDKCYGFDFYILKTHEVDLRSKLGMTLKRDMLVALAKKDFYPNDAEMQSSVSEKYKEFLMPLEEAEWVGLSLQEAERKQNDIEEMQRLEELKPLKYSYVDKLLADIRQKKAAVSSEPTSLKDSVLKVLNPFKKE